jgi:hypothetical protein
MKLIAHRGNTRGSNPEQENSPDYILAACASGFDVEIDVWLVDGCFYLGHDAPKYPVDDLFLCNPHFWCHAKNLPALVEMLKQDIHCFWHQTDDVVLTSRGYIWTYPGKPIASEKAIAVCPERVEGWDIGMAMGVCSDFVSIY